MSTWVTGSSRFCTFGCSSPGRSSPYTESADSLPQSGSGFRDTTYRCPGGNETTKSCCFTGKQIQHFCLACHSNAPYHSQKSPIRGFIVGSYNEKQPLKVTMPNSTYTCLSRGTDGSTLSPRRGGVSPTRRSVVESTELVAWPALASQGCSVCTRERSRSAPSNWTVAKQGDTGSSTFVQGVRRSEMSRAAVYPLKL